MGLLLFILSILLGVVLLPLGILYGLFKSFYRHHFDTGLKLADLKFLELAKALDKYGNVVCAEVFNDLFITRDSIHHFGRIEQTISKVIGYNLLAGTLSRWGRLLNAILDFIDKDHSLKAIREDVF